MSKNQRDSKGGAGFAKAMKQLGDVEPIDRDNLSDAPVPAPPPRERTAQPTQASADEAEPSRTKGASIVRATRREMRDLRAGKIRPQEKVDLHGFTREQGHRRLCNAVARAQADGKRCLLVVHGKGQRSPGGRSILREALEDWLRARPLREQVIGSAVAQPSEGGSGASYLLLRAPVEKKPAK
ncbi:MAG: Smr/MutS family protein [bacterium]|nr:Smr/MutS family protein [bacterium]